MDIDRMAEQVLISIGRVVGKLGEQFQKTMEENLALRGKAAIDLNTISIRKIKNGFVVSYSEGTPYEVGEIGAGASIYGAPWGEQITTDDLTKKLDDDMTGKAPVEPEEPAMRTFYRWRRVELFAKDAAEMATLIPEALRALVLREDVKEKEGGEDERAFTGFNAPAAIGAPAVGAIGGYVQPASPEFVALRRQIEQQLKNQPSTDELSVVERLEAMYHPPDEEADGHDARLV